MFFICNKPRFNSKIYASFNKVKNNLINTSMYFFNNFQFIYINIYYFVDAGYFNIYCFQFKYLILLNTLY